MVRDILLIEGLYNAAIEYVRVDTPLLSWTARVIYTAYRGSFSPFIVIATFFALGFIAKQLPCKIVEILAAILALGVILVPTVYWHTTYSIAMLNFAVAFVMVATVFILNFAKLSALDYAIMFSAFTYLHRFVGIARPASRLAWDFGLSLSVIFIMAVIMMIYKFRLGKLKGNLFYCWFTCMLVCAIGYIASYLFFGRVLAIGQAQTTRVETLAVWGVAILTICGLSALVIYVVKRLFSKHFDNINKMGKSYPLIERFIILNSIFI